MAKLKRPQAKGKAYEREMAKLIKKLSGDALEVFRVPCSGAIPGFEGDLRILAKDPPWGFVADIVPECKKQEKLNIWKALQQAEDAAGRHKFAVIFARNFSKDYICMSLNDFFSLLAEIIEGSKPEGK